jgi:hypothetical protein
MRLAILLGLAAVVGAYVLGASHPFSSPASPLQLRVGVAFSPVGTTMPPDPVRDYMIEIETMEMHGQYAALDQLAVGLRNIDNRFTGGEPKITAFYAALGDFAGCGCPSVRDSFISYDAKLKVINAWIAAIPNSPTAPVAMAKLLRQYAWMMRGHDSANETDAQRLQQFQDITRRSVTYLQPLDPRSDPAIYVGLLSAGRASDTGRADMDRIFPAAVAAFPTYYPYYENEADMLQERWFGAPGEAGRFLAALPALGDTGLVAYAAAVGRLDESNESSNLPHIFGIDWSILKRAFDTRRRLYDTNDYNRNEEMKLAVVFGDRAYAKNLLGEIGQRWAPRVWRRWSSFDQAVAWVDMKTDAAPFFN